MHLRANFPEEEALRRVYKRGQLLKKNGLLEEYQSSAGKADTTFTRI